tara:strand:- start:245 stop:496 length:252 start_codon:yes stop_codon:yes gene_type:complete
MSDYESPEVKTEEPAPAPEKPMKKKREGVKMTDKQKTQLTKHMEKMKKGGMEGSELKSHRMRMMSKMRNQGLSVGKAHKLISS